MLNKLNVGCGSEILKNYVNLDLVPLAGVDIVHNLTEFPWPFEDNQFEEIRIINVLEHLPDTIKTIEEVWRIARPGCKVIIRVPYWNCWQSIGDPTHIKQFHQKSFDFFDPERKQCQIRPYYTPVRFKIGKIYYWFPLVPIRDSRGWIRIKNILVKSIISFLAMYLNNIIWAVEFELTVLKDKV